MVYFLEVKLCIVSTTALKVNVTKRRWIRKNLTMHGSSNTISLRIQQQEHGGCFLSKKRECTICSADFTMPGVSIARAHCKV